MPSQFVHLGCYGAQARARRKPHENAFDIIDEAARAPGAARHVPRPQPPVELHGVPLRALKDRVAEFAGTARDRRGARLRRDGTILYAIVVSYPVAWRKIEGEDALSLYAQWRDAVVDWLTATFGDALQSVVEHVDEAQPHLHAFVIPPLCPRNRIDHRLHPGHAAREAAVGNGANRLAGERAYREGMRRWQDDFHAAVSSQFGHDRTGPRRRRFRRDVALARQASDRLLERMESILKRVSHIFALNPLSTDLGETAELEILATLLSDVRHHLQSGRPGALDKLDAALTKLAEAGDAVWDPTMNESDLRSVADTVGWISREDDPDPEAALGYDMDDDPDPERLEDDERHEDWDDDPDDDYVADHHYEEDDDPDR
jgi:hypothetical protein